MEQFEGYFDLQDIDLAAHEPRDQSIPSILGIEETQGTQVIKQPDVLMLLYLLEDRYDMQTLHANWDYYTSRTDLTYGSSLGPPIQALLAARMGHPDLAHAHFIHSARTDLQDARGNADQGIHGATAGGLWQAVVFGFAGLRLSEQGYTTTSRLPAHWKRLSFSFVDQGERIEVELTQDGEV
jgi:kojibiose phosphorylase